MYIYIYIYTHWYTYRYLEAQRRPIIAVGGFTPVAYTVYPKTQGMLKGSWYVESNVNPKPYLDHL